MAPGVVPEHAQTLDDAADQVALGEPGDHRADRDLAAVVVDPA
jgi:hypothetical protein